MPPRPPGCRQQGHSRQSPSQQQRPVPPNAKSRRADPTASAFCSTGLGVVTSVGERKPGPVSTGANNATHWFYLASTYFLRGLPPKYRRRCSVSQPSSRWIGVVPLRHGHQDRRLLRVFRKILLSGLNPENCIGYWLSPALDDKALELESCSRCEHEVGQALGLLVLLCFTHYCAST